MNYYEHHIGDYAEATSHLSFVEDAAYSRCIRKYYATEKPLPAEIKAVQRLVGARTKEEKDAVETVLNEFFELQDDGWHNHRCDEEIARYLAGEPDRQIKRANEDARLKKHREERSRLFQALHAAGQFPAWNIPIAQLRELHERFCAVPATPLETLQPPLPATAPATPATATHTPDTSPQYPDTRHQALRGEVDISSHSEIVSGATRSKNRGDQQPTPQAVLAIELRELNVRTSSIDPVLIRWLNEGFTREQILDAVNRSKQTLGEQEQIGSKYVDKVLRSPPKRSARERQQAENIDASQQWLREQEAKDAANRSS